MTWMGRQAAVAEAVGAAQVLTSSPAVTEILDDEAKRRGFLLMVALVARPTAVESSLHSLFANYDGNFAKYNEPLCQYYAPQ